MKKKQKVAAIVVLAFVSFALIAAAVVYQHKLPEDRCTSRDREINNCVPAGKCHPNPELDAVMDCDVKQYDKKLNTEI